MIEAEIIEESFKAPVLQDVIYPVTQNGLQSLLDKYEEVPTIDPEGENVAEEFKYVNDGRKALVKARTSIEKVRKELKAPSLEYGKKVDSIAKEFQSLIAAKELQLTTQCKIVENHEKLKQEAYEQAERDRRDAIRLKIEKIKNLPLDHFNSSAEELTNVLESLRPANEDEYEEFTEDDRAALDVTTMQLQTARENKIKTEQAEKIQAENEKRLTEEQRIKDEESRKEREKFEAEKAEFQRQKDEQQRVIDEQQEQINLQNAEREAEALAKQQEIQQEEFRKQREREAEALVKEKAEKEKIDAENFKSAKDITFSQMNALKTKKDILAAIIDGKIDNVRWVQ